MIRFLLFLSVLLPITLKSAAQSVARYGFSFESPSLAMSGVMALRDSCGTVNGALINDFGITALSFRCDIAGRNFRFFDIIGFLDHWWIRSTLKKDMHTAVMVLYGRRFNPGKNYHVTHSSDTVLIRNTRRSLTYAFYPLDGRRIPLRTVTDRVPFNIWEDSSVGARVTLTPYLADGDRNIACIICPGGSYFWLDRENEGYKVAEWLCENGISAFVLEYRVGGIPAYAWHTRLVRRGNRYPDMLCDVQRAISVIRSDSGRYGIDPARIGVIGFSAGGHLAAMSGMYFDAGVLPRDVSQDSISLRPDFVASIYPVVSFRDRSTHKRSRRGALGEWHDITEGLKDSLSLEKHVRIDMPPVYLMNCDDDHVVAPRNSQLLDSALTAVGVPHRYMRCSTGGHGFGVTDSKTSVEASGWKSDFLRWLKEIFPAR